MRFNKAKCKLLHLDRGSPCYQYQLGDERIESSPVEKDLGVLVDEKLDMSHQCALAAQKTNYPGVHQEKRGQQVEAGDSALLLHSGETSPGVLHPALEPSAQDGHASVGADTEEGHKNSVRAGSHLL